jgi:hypothetical protein
VQKKGEWDGLLGIRRDIDLTDRWWHRLAKVVYFVPATLVFALVWFMTWDSFDNAEVKTNNIKVTATLGGFLRTADSSVPNVIPAFRLAPGKEGLISEDGKTVGYLSDFSLSKSWCTPSATDHLQETADFLNEANYTKVYTAMEILNAVVKAKPNATERSELCWMEAGLRNRDFDDIVKWEFTRVGYYYALFEHFLMPTFWLLVAHTIFLNFYYRGVVYVIVGPRKKAKAVVQADDDDELIA